MSTLSSKLVTFENYRNHLLKATWVEIWAAFKKIPCYTWTTTSCQTQKSLEPWQRFFWLSAQFISVSARQKAVQPTLPISVRSSLYGFALALDSWLTFAIYVAILVNILLNPLSPFWSWMSVILTHFNRYIYIYFAESHGPQMMNPLTLLSKPFYQCKSSLCIY